MKRIFETRMILLALAVVMAVSIQFSGKAFADYDEGELIIKVDEQYASEIADMKAELEVYEVQVLHSYAQMSGGYRTTWSTQYWQYRSTLTVSQIVSSYSGSRYVSYIEPDYRIYPWGIPDDTQFAEQWGMHNTGQTGGNADADTDAPEAWDYADGKPADEVTVAVIDTGVDADHPDLQGSMSGFGRDFHNNDADPDDDNGHGTHIAGIIAAVRDNAAGIAGVSGSARITSLKFLDENGEHGDIFNAVRSLNYARETGARIINASWSTGGYFSYALEEAIAEARDAGQLFVAAAGNGGPDHVGDDNDVTPDYPSGYDLDNIIAVAASDHNDELAGFSNYGAGSVDLAAPGSGIYSTLPGNGYGSDSGTSMAAAHVSGVASLIWSLEPELSYTEVRQRILDSVDITPALNWKTVTGGRLNAYRAVMKESVNIYIDATFSGAEIGTANAPFKTIQAGIDAARDGDTLLVLPGTYIENISFNGKNITLKSAEGVEKTIIDGNRSGSVVTFENGEDANAMLDGFTLTNGTGTYALPYPTKTTGGGIYCVGSSPTITNCILSNNSTTVYGGGMYNGNNSSPIIANCTFTNNSTTDVGGGMFNAENSSPTVSNCTFSSNSAQYGGGINNAKTNVIISNCVFTDNSANFGGGIHTAETNATIVNCTFADNRADTTGGGIDVSTSNITIRNCIFWNNTALNSPQIDSTPTVSHSLIQGGFSGVNNIDADPLFLDAEKGDYRLSDNSPCIDTGTSANAPNGDIEGKLRDSKPDMGAYELGPNLADTDADGLPDDWEKGHFGNLDQNGADDYDNDGLTNSEEYKLGTDPAKPDTDDDGLTDQEEYTLGTDPAKPDSDNDGWTDSQERNAGTDPKDPDDHPNPNPPEACSGDGKVSVPLILNNTESSGIESIDIKLEYDENVLVAISARLEHGILEHENYEITYQIEDGEISLSIFAENDLFTGSGTVAYLDFYVAGETADDTTELRFTKAKLNESQADTDNILVKPGCPPPELSGTIRYYKDDNPVRNVLVELGGDHSDSVSTKTDGKYGFSLPEIPADYIVTPYKNDHFGGLSGMDASRIAKYAAGFADIQFDCYQRIAADVNRDGQITGLDASRVARYAAGKISYLNGEELHWAFVPTQDTPSMVGICYGWPPITYQSHREYSPLDSDKTDQDFIAVRLGDVTGNWTDDPIRAKRGPYSVCEVKADQGSMLTLPVVLNQKMAIEGIDITLEFNNTLFELTDASLSRGILRKQGYALIRNTDSEGRAVLVITANAGMITGSGEIISLTFDVIGEPGEGAALWLTKFESNENSVRGGFQVDGGVCRSIRLTGTGESDVGPRR